MIDLVQSRPPRFKVYRAKITASGEEPTFVYDSELTRLNNTVSRFKSQFERCVVRITTVTAKCRLAMKCSNRSIVLSDYSEDDATYH